MQVALGLIRDRFYAINISPIQNLTALGFGRS